MASGGPWYGFEGESTTALHLVEYDQATSNGIERETIEHALRRAYEAGAEAMRERAATYLDAEADKDEVIARTCDSDRMRRSAASTREDADAIRALPLTDDAREDGGSDGE